MYCQAVTSQPVIISYWLRSDGLTIISYHFSIPYHFFKLGLRNRTRVIQNQNQCGGIQCDQSALLISEMCESYINSDCKLTEWSSWSSCSTNCGVGFRERYRSVLQPAKCKGNPCGVLFENKTCSSFTNSNNCTVSIILSETNKEWYFNKKIKKISCL